MVTIRIPGGVKELEVLSLKTIHEAS
jgi:hypothetical protein